MIRFILVRETNYPDGFHHHEFETLDVDVPELEAILRRGGYGPEQGWDHTTLQGAEVLKAEAERKQQ